MSSIANAPIISEYEADNTIYLDGFISSLANRAGIDLNSPKWIVREYMEKYGLGEDFYRTIECESGFRHSGLFGDENKAYGILQYHKPTFQENCEGDYYDMRDQLKCGANMWKKGMENRWSCFNKLNK